MDRGARTRIGEAESSGVGHESSVSHPSVTPVDDVVASGRLRRIIGKSMPRARSAGTDCGMQDYTKILAWRQACALTVSVREAALAIRAHDAPGLRSQLMR